MANFTITTTPRQDEGVAAMVRRANDRIAARNAANPGLPADPLWTPVAYVRSAVSALLDGWSENADATMRDQLRDAWSDPVKREAIKAAAGIV